MKARQQAREFEKVPAPVLTERFGPLQGLRVLSTGNLILGPFAGSMFADFGAEVIHIEEPGVGDLLRQQPPLLEQNGRKVSLAWLDSGRNRLSMELDLRSNNPQAREVFLRLVKSSDVWIDSLNVDQYSITDALVRKANPAIAIIHASSYGRPEFGGEPEKCRWASNEITDQAYGGWTNLVGEPDGAPVRIPAIIDYVSALNVFFSGMVGYIDAQKRGKGQSFDSAAFESIGRIMYNNFSGYFNLGVVTERQGNKNTATQPYGIFKAKDGYVGMGAYGFSVFGRFLKAMTEATGINPEKYPFLEVSDGPETLQSPKGKELDRITTEWIAQHTRKEVNDLFARYEVPCSPVYTTEDAANDPHWTGRDNFIEFTDQTTQDKVKSFGIAPKLSETPGKVWRGAPALGQDTDDILTKILGYSAKEVEELRKKKVVCT